MHLNAILLFTLSTSLFLASSCANTPTRKTISYSEKMFSIPVTEADGNIRSMQTRICFPETTGPSTIVVINHGSPPSPADRPKYQGYACDSEAAQWFLEKGFIVVSPIRRGYGATGGTWSESYGKCENADYFKAGLETARDIAAAVEFSTALPEAAKDHAVVVGQSAGGWGTIAFNSLPHPKVAAIINMAGGRGGHFGRNHDENCAPELLAKAAAIFGKTATTPMLWMYAENDSFFPPPIAQSLYQSFTDSGGLAQFVKAPSFGHDGHLEFGGKGGSKVWGPEFEKYLASRIARPF